MKEQELVNILGIDGNKIICRAYGIRPKLTYLEFFTLLIQYGSNLKTEKDFKTFRFLNNIYPNKPKKVTWDNYILGLVNLKYCNKCKSTKNIEKFSKDKNRYLGIRSTCKSCTSDAHKIYQKEYYLENKEKIDIKNHNHYENNKEMYLEKSAKRRATKLNATPKWYENEEINELYKQSSKEVHIDHILPLVNKLVCGLHCFDNLQAIPAKENLSKSNKFDQDFESMEQMEWLLDRELAC